MGRAPFQILVFPYRPTQSGDWEFAVFQLADEGWWQGIAGGGEDDETPLQAARRECFEEAGIPISSTFVELDAMASIKVIWFRDYQQWGADRFVIPEHAFGVEVAEGTDLVLSHEHLTFRWLPYEEAEAMVRFDSNRTALWELNLRIRGLNPQDSLALP